jgi:DNA-binding NtrC family response regulator
MLVLAIDDEPSMLEFYKDALSSRDIRVETAADPGQGLALLAQLNPDLVFLDLVMPGMNGTEVLHRIREHNAAVSVVMVTGQYTVDSAVEAIREGATDYLGKPVSVEKLRRIAQQVEEQLVRQRRSEEINSELIRIFNLEGLVGRSPAMLEVFDLVQRVAPHFRTALVIGETGTGKELVARALHNLSPRKEQRFAIANCAAIVETLTESQLFGHTKGAFTGALEDKTGLFEWANRGTVFLDEIGELSPQIQSKLLRVVEYSEVQKVGAPQPRQVDVNIIAATSRDLKQEAKGGKFRSDLWYRLNMVEIHLPPLRQRSEDLLLLSNYFLDHFRKQYRKEIRDLSRRAQNALLGYSWPGNVRELQNVIGRACLLARGNFIDVSDLALSSSRENSSLETKQGVLQENERAAILKVLATTKNKREAARVLGIGRTTLYRLMRKYGIEDKQEE